MEDYSRERHQLLPLGFEVAKACIQRTAASGVISANGRRQRGGHDHAEVTFSGDTESRVIFVP